MCLRQGWQSQYWNPVAFHSACWSMLHKLGTRSMTSWSKWWSSQLTKTSPLFPSVSWSNRLKSPTYSKIRSFQRRAFQRHLLLLTWSIIDISRYQETMLVPASHPLAISAAHHIRLKVSEVMSTTTFSVSRAVTSMIPSSLFTSSESRNIRSVMRLDRSILNLQVNRNQPGNTNQLCFPNQNKLCKLSLQPKAPPR